METQKVKQVKPATPQQYAQKTKMGTGWAVVRNSATLAVSDYERVADEIVDALNRRIAYPKLVKALCALIPVGDNDGPLAAAYRKECDAASALLRELGEL